MRRALLTIQDKQISIQQSQILESIVKEAYSNYVSDEGLFVVWVRIPEGQGYTNYKPSQSSIISVECNNDFPQGKRIDFLSEIELKWRAVTGQEADDLLIALVEEDLFSQISSITRKNLSIGSKMKIGSKVAGSIMNAKFSGNPTAFKINS